MNRDALLERQVEEYMQEGYITDDPPDLIEYCGRCGERLPMSYKALLCPGCGAAIVDEKENNKNTELISFVRGILSQYNATPDEWEHFNAIMGVDA